MARLNKKRSRGSDVDRISELPDELLLHILSFVSTRDAVRTCLLSFRWKSLWMLVPCFDLDTEQFSYECEFYNFMDRYLCIRGDSRLERFKLTYNLFKRQSSCFKSWIEAAIRCKVEHLEVESYCYRKLFGCVDNGVETPQSFCICNTLVVLKVEGVDKFDVPDRISLSNLKIMHLTNVKFANDIALKNLISSCQVLEELSIVRESEDKIRVLYICSRTLKQLILYFKSSLVRGYGVVIDAPNLEYLKLFDRDSKNFTITNTGSSSLRACFNVQFGRTRPVKLKADDISRISNIYKLFTGFSNARSLTIHLATFELLCQYTEFRALPQFHNLVHLEAELSEKRCKMLPAIFKCCPNLKIFILKLYNRKESNLPRLSTVEPQRMLSSLETIILREPIIGGATEMDLIKYFLKTSIVLKEMKVYLFKHLKQEKKSKISEELLMFPRESTTCQVYIEEERFS